MKRVFPILSLLFSGLLSVLLCSYAEGTKQIRPDSTNSFGALRVDRNSANYTRFAYLNCPPWLERYQRQSFKIFLNTGQRFACSRCQNRLRIVDHEY